MKDKIKTVNEGIQKILLKELWKEAKELVKLAPEENLDELISLYEEDNRNIFCLALDAVKYNLVKNGTLTESDFPNFGIQFDNP